MCRERRRTRDRLLEYDPSIVIPTPHTAGLRMIYPWENASLAILSHQIFKLAQANGYTGPEELLFKKFNGGNIYKYDTLNDFPVTGTTGDLYIDISTGIVYYYISTSQSVDAEKIAIIGGAIVGYSIVGDTTETHLYLPIRALPVENLIYDCGDAAEYIG